ncbi:hypothetical protein LIER_32759 [Lithospermum erythrorhizon]|uniref:Heme-binding protein n=1 Tax=Lithospermum erythrorhizon TaxID=34254 RepID=A0AAV3S0L1_LITER
MYTHRQTTYYIIDVYIMMISFLPKIAYSICFILSCFLFDHHAYFVNGKKFPIPLNCLRYECPSYDIIQTNMKEGFEIRKYNSAAWASTRLISSTSFILAANQAFLTLFNYTQGANDRARKFNLTAPVLIDVYTPTPPSSTRISSYVIYFYLPRKYQKRPPLSNKVSIVKLPPHEYAAVRRTSSAFLNQTNTAYEVSSLRNSLRGTSWVGAVTAPAAPLTAASYNAPFELKDRVNEVIIWFDV